jgi:ectoine hydroxylase-related dioxygenase (phytanoyl-CoA dioxygenase family)
MLIQEQIDFYREQGYLGVPDVLSAAEVSELRKVTDEFVEKSRSVADHTDVFDLEPGHTPENPKLRRLKSPITQHAVYKKTLHHEKILEIVTQLIGYGLRCNGNKLNMKQPGYGSPVEWHQDWSFYPHTNDDLLAVGVAIDDMTEENGPLLVVPQSHKGPIYDHHYEGHFCGAVTDPAFSDKTAVPVMVKAGGITIHHVRMLHGSVANTSSKQRRLMLFQYCAMDAWPLSGIKDYDGFNDAIVQGEPSNIPRVEPVPVRMPLPPSLKSGSIYESQTALKKSTFGRG